MSDQLRLIFQRYDYDYSNINMSLELKDVIIQVERDLIFGSVSAEISRKLMCDLWQLQRRNNITHIQKNILKDSITELTEKLHYIVRDPFIVCNKFIPCTAIKTKKAFYILNDLQIKRITDMGYGVTSFRIELNKTIRDIYCKGSHPNLNSLSGSFCIDSDLKDIDFTVSNMEMVEEMLSQINLNSCFLKESEYNQIVEVVE